MVAPLYNLEHVYNGEHLSEISRKMTEISRKKTPGENLITNQNPRYHYLKFPEKTYIVPSIVDFKHYFSVSIDYLLKCKNQKFICQIAELYREDLSQRFSAYLSRVGLP